MDSENSKSSVGFVGVECLIIAIIAGIYKQSFVYGAAAFILVMVLYEIPVVSGVASVWMSMIDAIIAGGLLSMVTSQNVSCIVSVFSFAMFITAHRNFSVISDDRIFGYSFIISECILNSLMLWYASSSIILACIVFAILIILMFTPILRVLELIALTVWTTIEVYSLLGVTLGSAEKKYILISSAFIFFYVAYNHISAYSLIDYKGMKIEKRRKQEFAKAEAKYEAMKEKLYGQYPELGKQYHYFKAGVCENEQEREVFETDWKAYLYYLENTSQLITFNQFFEASGLYESRTYNRDFAREWKQKQEHGQTDEQMKNEEFDDDNIIYFAGVKDAEALKKRYRDLLKIYHPDNQNGDTSTVQQIQKEYDFLKSKYGIN